MAVECIESERIQSVVIHVETRITGPIWLKGTKMTENNTTLDTDNAETTEPSELEDVAATVEEIAAADLAGESDGTADTVDTANTGVEDNFEPTDTQIALAKQLGFSDEYAGGMTEAQAEAADQFGRAQSRLQQRKGNPVQKKDEDEEPASVDSSAGEATADDDGDGDGDDDGDDDEFFKEEDWYTDEGRKKLNNLHKLHKKQAARDQKQQTSEQDRLQAEANKVFDALNPEFFPAFSPGESDLIESGSAAEAKRNEALQMARTIQATAESLGHEIPLEKAIQKALSVVAETETQNAAEHEANQGRKERRGQRIASPSSSSTKRNKTYATPEEEAVDKIFDFVNG